jgi:hypothetical protein
MQKDRQLAQNEAGRAAGLEEQLSQRNKQIAGIIQSLATSFDLGERPLPLTEDIKAEGLWQQHDRVITLLTTRLVSEQLAKTKLQQSYQAETVKRAEKEALIETLQSTLTTQTSELSKLEQALEEQKSLLQLQQDKAQQVLSQTLEKHLSELAGLTELKQQTLDLVNTGQQLTQLEEKLSIKDAVITQLERTKPVDQVNVQVQPPVIKQEEKETRVELEKINEEVPAISSDIKQPPVSPVKEQTSGVTGRIKNLFGKSKQEPMIAEPQSVETKPDEAKIQPVPAEAVQQPISAAKGQFGKIKNLFGGTKQQPEDTKQAEEEARPAPVDVQQTPVIPVKDQLGRIKHYFGDIKQQPEDIKQEEAETQPAPMEVEQPQLSAAKGQLGRLKNLFGKTK